VFCLLDSCSSFNAQYRSSLTRQNNELCSLPRRDARSGLGAAVAAGSVVADRVAEGFAGRAAWRVVTGGTD
jgi:hypothetical protein